MNTYDTLSVLHKAHNSNFEKISEFGNSFKPKTSQFKKVQKLDVYQSQPSIVSQSNYGTNFQNWAQSDFFNFKRPLHLSTVQELPFIASSSYQTCFKGGVNSEQIITLKEIKKIQNQYFIDKKLNSAIKYTSQPDIGIQEPVQGELKK